MTPTAQIAAIRQRAEQAVEDGHASLASLDRATLFAIWDTHQSALRALVAELRDRAMRRRMAVGCGRPGDYIQASHEAQAREIDMCADALERLLESEP